ncbi:MAG: hypothetical protein MHM6MM_001167 [Cercozoa sp. M6MM]
MSVASSSGTEVSETSVYAVVYELAEKKSWRVSHEGGWSELHLYRDVRDGTYRIVGWLVSEEKPILINVNITELCKLKIKTPDFHKLTDETGKVWGFGYHNGTNSLEQAHAFGEQVLQVITRCKEEQRKLSAPPPVLPPPPPTQTKNTATSPRSRWVPRPPSVRRNSCAQPQFHKRESDGFGDDIFAAAPMGKLDILPVKPLRGPGSDEQITDPLSAMHVEHATYDPHTRTYTGIPHDWKKQLEVQFGLPPRMLELRRVRGYKDRIPSVLVQMRHALCAQGGLESEGIFRLAPDAEQCECVKRQLNDGTFRGCNDVNIVANLIKVWFRDLPEPILSPLPAEDIEKGGSPAAAGELVQRLPEPNNSIVLWLLDLCCEVTEHQSMNRMTPKNIAIVITPNLITSNFTDPIKNLTFSQKAADFVENAILWRMQNDPITPQVCL